MKIKKLNYKIWLGAILLSTAICAPSSAQNCATPPSCESLGYIRNSTECNGTLMLKCPFDSTKVFCSKAQEAPSLGDIVYSDGTWNTSLIPGKTPIGVLAFFGYGMDKGYIVSPEDKTLAWATVYVDTTLSHSTCSGMDTDNVVGSNSQYPAANYCHGLGGSGGGFGKWILPTSTEVRNIFGNLSAVNRGLNKIGSRIGMLYHWTACEASAREAYHTYPSATDAYYKGSPRPTRCIRRVNLTGDVVEDVPY